MLFYNFSKFWVLGDVRKNYVALLGFKKKLCRGCKNLALCFFPGQFFPRNYSSG